MEHIFIVVQIEDSVTETEEEPEDPNRTILVTCNAKTSNVKNKYPGFNGKVELLDYKTLQLDLIKKTPRANKLTYKMYFDLVTLTSEDFFLVELSHMMDEFLLHHRDCCLIRFSAQRKWHLTFLYNTLITEVNKRLNRLNATINNIRVDYKDILKNSTSDMLHCARNSTQRNYYCRHRTKYCNNTFKNTDELLYWLLNGHRKKWNTANGHVFLEIKFMVRDEDHRILTLKFTLFDVYLNKMDNADCFKWKSFVEQIGDGADSKFKHSPLTFMLSEHLEPTSMEYSRTLLFFDVPIDENNVTPTVSLLRMADALFKRRNKVNLNLKKPTKENNNPVDDNKKSATKQMNEIPSTEAKASKKNQTKQNEKNSMEANIHSQTFCVDTKYEKKKESNENIQNYYRPNDLNCLSFWYQGIDEKFASVRSAMQIYFERFYALKVTQICNDINIMGRNIDNTTKTNDPMDSAITVLQYNVNIREVYNNYISKYLEFKKLIRDIEHSKFSEFLKIYLETKNYELYVDVIKFKIKQLTPVSDILNNELSKLNISN